MFNSLIENKQLYYHITSCSLETFAAHLCSSIFRCELSAPAHVFCSLWSLGRLDTPQVHSFDVGSWWHFKGQLETYRPDGSLFASQVSLTFQVYDVFSRSSRADCVTDLSVFNIFGRNSAQLNSVAVSQWPILVMI